MTRKIKERYLLIDAQNERKMELHVAFHGKDNDDQIICDLPESVVLELVKKDMDYLLNKDFEIDVDVKEHIKSKYSL